MTFNVDFLRGKRPRLKVRQEQGRRVLSEVFNNPNFDPEQKFRVDPHSDVNVPSTTVQVVIDFEKYANRHTYEVSMDLLNAHRICDDPYELFEGHPYNLIHLWKTSSGQNLLSWAMQLATSQIVRPDERTLFGGSTRAEIRGAEEAIEIAMATAYRRR
ncbi:MAG TPA: hypothetical protein PLX95_02570 [bacterium]|nr:hypothetical protein [bacterium]